MTERRKPRPRDPLQLAKFIGDIARFSALTRTRARRRLSASQMTIHGAQSRSPSPALYGWPAPHHSAQAGVGT